VSWLLFLILAQSEFHGTLAPELSIPPVQMQHTFKLATEEQRKPLGAIDGKVFIGTIRDARAWVVESTSTVLYVDLGGPRKFDLHPGDPIGALVADVDFRLPGPTYKAYPVLVYVYPSGDGAEILVSESQRAYAHGVAKINQQEVAFDFEYLLNKNAILPDHGEQTVDGDATFLNDERPVYHAAGTYFSVRSIDVARREFVLEERAASEYTRIVLKVGEIFPDFAFTDFEGGSHKLSDFAGKPVLLDFWATWCKPCMADLPRLGALHARGLAIIGMNVDQEPDKPRALHLAWPQAAFPSIQELVEHRARIRMYPTDVLLDSDRRIIALGRDAVP
jgi:thiol-disulfide isomerase/thioredoxin